MKKIENVKDLRNHLIKTLEELRGGKIGLRDARTTATVSGKIIKSAELQMEYNAYSGSKKKVQFLESDD